MGKIYEKAEDGDCIILDKVMSEFHGDIKDADVKVGLINVFQDDDHQDKPVLTKSGAKCSACIKVVGLKDRLVKGYDVEILLDGDYWKQITAKQRVAILDHELEHLRLTVNRKTGKVKMDSLNRPKLRMIPDDIQFWGFSKIAERHHENSQESICFMQLAKDHGKKLTAKN